MNWQKKCPVNNGRRRKMEKKFKTIGAGTPVKREGGGK